jgi:hypothetical protein
MSGIDDIFSILSKYKFPVEDEKRLQGYIEDKLRENRIVYAREFFLDEHNIPDFIVGDGVVIEVKIKGSKRDIYAQILRYSKFDDVKSILVITNKNIGNPPLYESKKLKILNLGIAWL